MAALRDELLGGVRGKVAEIGAGNGMNLTHYSAAVETVFAIEPEPYLRRLATEAARTVPTPVTVLPGTAEQLPLPTASVDVAVLCLVLCSVTDRGAALSEVRRVLRPGGSLRFLEHCVADVQWLRRLQRIADATVWPLLSGGCHTATDPLGEMTAAGFDVTEVRHLRFPDGRVSLPATPHVLGTARVPA